MGIIMKPLYKDPYESTRIQWNVVGGFERWAAASNGETKGLLGGFKRLFILTLILGKNFIQFGLRIFF